MHSEHTTPVPGQDLIRNAVRSLLIFVVISLLTSSKDVAAALEREPQTAVLRNDVDVKRRTMTVTLAARQRLRDEDIERIRAGIAVRFANAAVEVMQAPLARRSKR